MNKYSENLRKVKSLLIVTSLQKKIDLKVLEALKNLEIEPEWMPLSNFMIDDEVWKYVTIDKKYDPKLVFCHPEVLIALPTSSLYYRGITGLSMKAAKTYFGSIENLEKGKQKTKLDEKKALKMARIYNTFICTVIKGSSDWTLENGKRTIIATLGITLDGIMRNKVGSIAEERVRSLVFEWLKEKDLIIHPTKDELDAIIELPVICQLKDNIFMKFSSEPDISFFRKTGDLETLLAVIEIKGGIDPAGALERYGAATKSFQHALKESQRCKNFFLSAVFTPELKSRIKGDRLVEKYYDIIDIFENPAVEEEFFRELFHYSLRLI
ncbi:MAG: XcyI family restriction endonuclease [Mariniphaga sp.]